MGSGSPIRLSIRTKIFLALLGGLLLGTLAVVSLYRALSTMTAALDHVTQVAEPISAAAYEMEINVVETGLGVMKYLETGEARYRAWVHKDAADFARFKAQYDRLAHTAQEHTLGDRIAALYQEFRSLGDLLMEARDKREALLTTFIQQFETVDTVLDDYLRARPHLEFLPTPTGILAVVQLENDLTSIGAWLNQYLRTTDAADRARIMDHAQAVQAELTRLNTLPERGTEQPWLRQLEQGVSQFMALLHSVLRLHERQQTRIERFLGLRTELDDLLDEEIQRLTHQTLATAKTALQDAMQQTHVRFLVLGLFGLLLSIAILVVSRRWLLTPLAYLVRGTEALSRGELEHRVVVRTHDELGRLAATFNHMAASLQQDRQALQQAHQALERRVQERTAELAQTVEQLQHSRTQVRALATRMRSLQEEERKHIAREIHDELGQVLTALILGLAWVKQRLSPEQEAVEHRLESMTSLADQALDMLGSIVTALRPRVLDDLGLAAAVEWQVREFQAHSGIAYTLTMASEPFHLDVARSTAVFRILQEALTNVARHANATTVWVSLRRTAETLYLDVQDNGQGIPDAALTDPQAFGLLGMRERVLPWHGVVYIRRAQEGGTIVTVCVPLIDVATRDTEEMIHAEHSYC